MKTKKKKEAPGNKTRDKIKILSNQPTNETVTARSRKAGTQGSIQDSEHTYDSS